MTTGITTIRATQAADTSGNFTTNYIDASFPVYIRSVTTLTYSIAPATAFKEWPAWSEGGQATTLSIDGEEVTITAYGGVAGTYQSTNSYPAGGTASGGTTNVDGGYGTAGSASNPGGGAGGSINGGYGIDGGGNGDSAANVSDYQGLSTALIGTGYSLGIGGLQGGRGTDGNAGQISGYSGSGIGAGGGGAGYYGGRGGPGSYGGGGGGGSAYYWSAGGDRAVQE